MVPTGRHKFEIRDLNEFSDNSVVVPLSLPKLPTNRREIVTGGLIRSTNSYDTDMSMSCESNTRPASLISTSEAESYEEEKARIDGNFTEKGLKVSLGDNRNIPVNNFDAIFRPRSSKKKRKAKLHRPRAPSLRGAMQVNRWPRKTAAASA